MINIFHETPLIGRDSIATAKITRLEGPEGFPRPGFDGPIMFGGTRNTTVHLGNRPERGGLGA